MTSSEGNRRQSHKWNGLGDSLHKKGQILRRERRVLLKEGNSTSKKSILRANTSRGRASRGLEGAIERQRSLKDLLQSKNHYL